MDFTGPNWYHVHRYSHRPPGWVKHRADLYRSIRQKIREKYTYSSEECRRELDSFWNCCWLYREYGEAHNILSSTRWTEYLRR